MINMGNFCTIDEKITGSIIFAVIKGFVKTD
jgi:hypothetical protein